MRLLVVDDEPDLLHPLLFGLTRAGFAADGAADGSEALEKATVTAYDVVLLDLSLPDRDGLDVCREIRASAPPDGRPQPRILMLTARDSLADRVRGLDEGADDYLVKPFDFPELLARVRALVRRGTVNGSAVLRLGELALDAARHDVSWSGRSIGLTRKEFGVLEYLMSRNGEVVSAEELLEHVWDENADPFTQTVRVTVGTLRRKLAAATAEVATVETLVGRGYRLKVAA